MPVEYYGPTAEYGYKVVAVGGPDSITISTRNVTGFPTEQVTVTVSYVNGTAAADASVSASVIGQWYYWWGANSSVVMYGQTDTNGQVVLELPVAPSVASAWKWLPVSLPAGQKTEQTVVGGETVNVTAYWEPTYVGLAASALVLPPTGSVQLKLHYQPVDYWATPAVGGVAPSAGATISSTPSGVPAASQQGSASSYYLPSTIPSSESSALAGGSAAAQGTAWSPTLTAVVAVSGAAIVAIGVAALVLVRRRPSK